MEGLEDELDRLNASKTLGVFRWRGRSDALSRQRVVNANIQIAPQVRSGFLQRKCACGQHAPGGECEECGKNKRQLQRKGRNGGEQIGVSPIVHEVLASSGRPLDTNIRAFMEPRFAETAGESAGETNAGTSLASGGQVALTIVPPGDPSEVEADRIADGVSRSRLTREQTAGNRYFQRDFSQVRVHTDPRAADSARAVDAEAYTVGHHIVFGAGRYAPSTTMGRFLLAHELVHVAQQNKRFGRSGEVLFRKGVTLGGFISNIGRGIADLFGGEPDYDDTTLRSYLKTLTDTKTIEGDQDSDNKARAVVGKGLFKETEIDIRILLIEEMLEGFTGDDDEQAIIKLVQAASPEERKTIAGRVGLEKLYDNFHGDELDHLYLFYPEFNSLHPRDRDESKSYSLKNYIDRWEKESGRTMKPGEKKVLANGCIGITMLTLGTMSNPDLTNCYGTFLEAWDAAKKMNEFLAAHSPDRKALVFSKRFYSKNKSYTPDPATGKVDMSGYDYSPRPGFTNFDYGLYNEKTGKWWHANHCDQPILADPDCDGPMEVYESNLQHYSGPLLDFDRQVFCVAIAMGQ